MPPDNCQQVKAQLHDHGFGRQQKPGSDQPKRLGAKHQFEYCTQEAEESLQVLASQAPDH